MESGNDRLVVNPTWDCEGGQRSRWDRLIPFGRMTYSAGRRQRTERRLTRRWSVTQLEIDSQQLLKERWGDGNLGDRVACVGDDTRRKMQPVVTETAKRFLLPFITEGVTLQQLNHCEGEYANGKVETIGRELTARKMIKSVVMLEFTNHLLKLATLVMEVDHGVSIFFFFGDIGGDDPVVVVAFEEIILVTSLDAFDHQPKGLFGLFHCVDGLRHLVVGFGAILKTSLFPSMLGDLHDSPHHGGIVVGGDREVQALVETMIEHKVDCSLLSRGGWSRRCPADSSCTDR